MDGNNRIENRKEIDFTEIVWVLLSQWKMILLSALIMAVLLGGVNYLKAVRSYNAKKGSSEPVVENVDVDEQISTIMGSLEPSKQLAVRNAVNQKKYLDARDKYTRESILINLDPYNLRVINIGYKINVSGDQSTVPALHDSYTAAFDSEAAMEKIGKTIDENADLAYIRELISFQRSNPLNSTALADDPTDSITVFITLPDGVDEDAVVAAATDVMKDFSKTLSSSIAPHSIKQTYANAQNVVNYDLVTQRNDAINWVNSLQNILKTDINELSTEQRTAYEGIVKLLDAGNGVKAVQDSVENQTPKPSVSKKAVLFGLIFGMLLYSLLSALFFIKRGNVESATHLQSITGSQVIGEMCYSLDTSGIKALFSSGAVFRKRFNNLTDETKQIEKIARVVVAICQRRGIEKVNIIELTNENSKANDFARLLSKSINEKGVENKVFDKSVDLLIETDLTSKDSFVIITNNKTAIKSVEETAFNIEEIGAKDIGNVFVRE